MFDLDFLGPRWQGLKRRWLSQPRLDLPLLLALIALCLVGLATVYSAGEHNPRLIVNQSLRMGMGFVAMYVLSRVPPHVFRAWTPLLFGLTLLLLVVVLLLGEGRGATRWLDLKFVRFQPSEIMKLAMPMMLAWYLHPRVLPPNWTTLGVCAVLIAIPALLVAKQPDLGTAILIALSGAFVIYLAGLSWWRILGFAIAGAAAMPVLWHFMHEYQRNRVRMLIDPESDALGNGWNIIQSKIAVGSGGLFGKGWMESTQGRLDFLPEHTTDFIFAVYSEEFGLLGVIGILLLYTFIVARALWIASEAKDTYSRLLGGAIALAFSVYVVVNGGMVAGLLPVVGVPMPLVSYGGTSAVSLLASFGILMSIHAHRRLLSR